MANEALINNLQELKQKNLDSIAIDQQTISSINQAIDQTNLNVDAYNVQKTDCEERITNAQTSNDLLDQTISILEQ